LYLPIVKIDTNNAQINTVSNSYIVAVDDDSVTDLDPNATDDDDSVIAKDC
jgi:hypothetical protein